MNGPEQETNISRKDIFSSRLKELRQQLRYNQADMARLLSMSTSGYQKIENGERGINIDGLCVVADFFDVSTDYLLGRVDGKIEVKTIVSIKK